MTSAHVHSVTCLSCRDGGKLATDVVEVVDLIEETDALIQKKKQKKFFKVNNLIPKVKV